MPLKMKEVFCCVQFFGKKKKSRAVREKKINRDISKIEEKELHEENLSKQPDKEKVLPNKSQVNTIASVIQGNQSVAKKTVPAVPSAHRKGQTGAEAKKEESLSEDSISFKSNSSEDSLAEAHKTQSIASHWSHRTQSEEFEDIYNALMSDEYKKTNKFKRPRDRLKEKEKEHLQSLKHLAQL